MNNFRGFFVREFNFFCLGNLVDGRGWVGVVFSFIVDVENI